MYMYGEPTWKKKIEYSIIILAVLSVIGAFIYSIDWLVGIDTRQEDYFSVGYIVFWIIIAISFYINYCRKKKRKEKLEALKKWEIKIRQDEKNRALEKQLKKAWVEESKRLKNYFTEDKIVERRKRERRILSQGIDK